MEMTYEYHIHWSDEDEAFIATVPGFPGCATDGDTPEAALREVQIALQGHIETRLEHNLPLPEDPAITRFRENSALFNLAEIAKQTHINPNTLRAKLKRGTRFAPHESKQLKTALASRGLHLT